MSLSEKETNRIDGIEKAVREETPVEDLNGKQERNQSFEAKKEGNVPMGDRIGLPPVKQPGKNSDWEFDLFHSPGHMGYMDRWPRQSKLKAFIKKLFGIK